MKLMVCLSKRRIVSFLLAAAMAIPAAVSAQNSSRGSGRESSPKKLSPKELPPHFRTWLEEEVVYIISAKEKDVFLQLQSDRERSLFIEAFWKQRDPNPATAVNEFKDEHIRRLTYVNKNFGRDSPGPGWRTDMGRIYIILGEPRQIMKYENLTDLFPTVIWFYDGMLEFGLPNAFSVVFFKRNGLSPYVLYSPVKDGPQTLLIHYVGDTLNYEGAFKEIMSIEPNVAEVSLSLISGESQAALSPSLSSEILLSSKIPLAPTAKVKDEYAEKLLRYKDLIEVDYTANYIDSEGLVRVFQDTTGQAFIHYLLEPKRLTFEEYQGKFSAEIEVNGHVSNDKGRTVYQFERRAPIEMTGDQIKKIKSRLFSFQDLFPLIPGQYKLSLLWKNRVSREFTSLEAAITVPEPKAFTMSVPILGNRIERNFPQRGQNKSFLFGDLQILPSPRNDFMREESLYLFLQMRNVPPDVLKDGVVSYVIFKDEERVKAFERNIRDYSDPGAILEEFPLAELEPAYYRIRVAVLDGSKIERVAAETPFFITPRPNIPRPWVMSLPLPPSGDASYTHTLGCQYLNIGQLDKARPLLAAAAKRDPSSVPFALNYARCLFQAGDPAGAFSAIRPFLADERRFDFLELAGRAAQALQDWTQAVLFYKDYLLHFGTNITVLNDLGECALRKGDKADALFAWEKSLELNPDQPKLRARVKSLKEKL